MNHARTCLLEWTECLLDPRSSPGRQRAAAHAWAGWAMARLGIDEVSIDGDVSVLTTGTDLDTGQAISPQRAALCVREQRRTAVFLQAMDAAIRAARERFPGETIHVVEAGCGPLAPMSLPFALRYAPDEVCFTLVDLHEVSLAGARALAQELGVAASLRAWRTGDAAQIRFAEAERPHVIGCEVLRRALKKEPQVAVTRALAPQLRAGGFFLPERIDLDLGFLHGPRRARQLLGQAEPGEPGPIEVLGRVFTLDAYAAGTLPVSPAGRIPLGAIDVPPHDAGRTPLELFTRMTVFRGHTLGDFECSLTMPERLRYPAHLAVDGGTVRLAYEISADPGVRVEA